MIKPNYIFFILVFTASLAGFSTQSLDALKEDPLHVKTWNRFAASLLELHKALISRQPNYSTIKVDGYANHPNFYREQSFFNEQNDARISTIQWENNDTNTVHSIEVLIRDPNSRVVRDYLAAYLPEFRNAPIQTLINLHAYNETLHGFRQFDASGDRIFEFCEGTYNDRDITFYFEEVDFAPLDGNLHPDVSSSAYRACFGKIPKKVGKYINPLIELNGPNKRTKQNTQLDTKLNNRLAQLDQILLADPNNTSALMERGKLHFDLLQFRSAVKDYTKVIAIEPTHYDAYFGRGMALGRMGEVKRGIEDLSTFLKHNPNSSLGYTKRGVRYLWAGDTHNAHTDLKKAIMLNPTNAEAHDDLGVIHARRGEYKKAQYFFETTIQLDPSYQKAYHNLAMVYFLNRSFKESLASVDQALELAPQSRNSLLLKSEVLEAMGDQISAQMIREQAEMQPQGNWSEQFPVH